jgi:thiol-disulfide isomerase/thioredoxin
MRRFTPFLLSALFAVACASAKTPTSPANTDLPAGAPLAVGPMAPRIESDTWINSQPLNWDSLRGKVTLVEFWTFECINCQHVFPIMRSIYADYRSQAFTLIGVHSPELSVERDLGNVQKAVKADDLLYPVAIDNDFANWNRYHNEYWPAWYLVDKQGVIRYSHIGEGGEDETRAWIDKLLAE